MEDKLRLYKDAIKKATTKEQLGEVSYKACLNEDNHMWNKVIDLCVKREIELGLLTSKA